MYDCSVALVCSLYYGDTLRLLFVFLGCRSVWSRAINSVIHVNQFDDFAAFSLNIFIFTRHFVAERCESISSGVNSEMLPKQSICLGITGHSP